MGRRMANHQRRNRGWVSDRRQGLPQHAEIRACRFGHRAARGSFRSAFHNADVRQGYRPLTGLSDAAPPGQVIARQRTHDRLQGPRRPLKQHMPSLSTLPGTDIHNLVGCTHHLGLVLHHNHRVAGIPKRLEYADQPLAVARVQTNTRFIQDIERVNQARPQAGRQVDPCCLSATQSAGGPIYGQVTEAHRLQVGQAGSHLTEDQPDGILRWQIQGLGGHLQKAQCLSNRQTVEASQVQRSGLSRRSPTEGQRLRAQATSLALGARLIASVPRQQHPHVHLIGLALQPAEVTPHPVPFVRPRLLGILRIVIGFPVHHPALLVLGHFSERHPGGNARTADLAHHVVLTLHAHASLPGLHHSPFNGLGGIRDSQCRIDGDDAPKSLARRTGPQRVIERKQGRLGLGGVQITARAMEPLRERLR